MKMFIRKPGEGIQIGDIQIVVKKIKDGLVYLGIIADPDKHKVILGEKHPEKQDDDKKKG